MEEVVVASLLTGATGIVVGVVLWWLRDGGIRSRQRAQIREDLELVTQLRDERPEMAERLNERIDQMLARYVPPPAEASGERSDRRLAWVTAVSLFVVTVPLLEVLEPVGPWTSLTIGGAIGVAVNVVVAIARWRRQGRSDAAPQPSVTRSSSGQSAGGPA